MCVEEEAEAMTFVCETDAVCPAKYVAILLKRLVTDYGVFWMSGPPSKTGLHQDPKQSFWLKLLSSLPDCIAY